MSPQIEATLLRYGRHVYTVGRRFAGLGRSHFDEPPRNGDRAGLSHPCVFWFDDGPRTERELACYYLHHVPEGLDGTLAGVIDATAAEPALVVFDLGEPDSEPGRTTLTWERAGSQTLWLVTDPDDLTRAWAWVDPCGAWAVYPNGCENPAFEGSGADLEHARRLAIAQLEVMVLAGTCEPFEVVDSLSTETTAAEEPESEPEPDAPPVPAMAEADREAWEQFRRSGLLWWVNRSLCLFGYTLGLRYRGDELESARPCRVAYRGFDRHSEAEGFDALTRTLCGKAPHLLDDVRRHVCDCNPVGDPDSWPTGDDCHQVGLCRQHAAQGEATDADD